MMNPSPQGTQPPIRSRLEQILDPDYTLCKEDVVWILEYVKKKVAEKDPHLTELSQPRLLENFHYFAEIAMLLIHQSKGREQEVDRLRIWLYEAVNGLLPERKEEK